MRRIAIIGYGNIARKHVEVARTLGVEVVGSCNRSKEGNLKAQREINVPKTFGDYHAMIRHLKPDGILVCVSFWEMNQVLSEVVPYGIPILAEKPSSTTLVDHYRLLELIKKYRTPVMIGLNRRHYSVLSKAINDAGGKDRITSVSVEWSEDPHHLINNRKLTSEQIKQYIFGNSIHGIDLMCWLAGSPQEVSVYSNDLGDPYRWIMTLNGISTSGVLLNFNSSWDNPVPWRVVFATDNRRYVFAPLEKCLVWIGGSKDPLEIEPSEEDVTYKVGFHRQFSLFLNGKFSDHTLDSVTDSMRIAQTLTDKFVK